MPKAWADLALPVAGAGAPSDPQAAQTAKRLQALGGVVIGAQRKSEFPIRQSDAPKQGTLVSLEVALRSEASAEQDPHGVLGRRRRPDPAQPAKLLRRLSVVDDGKTEVEPLRCEHPVVSQYHLVSFRPASVEALLRVAEGGAVDLVQVSDLIRPGSGQQLPKEAIEALRAKGIGIEIVYAPALRSSGAARRALFAETTAIARSLAGAGAPIPVVLSSGAEDPLDLRTPEDMAELLQAMSAGAVDLGKESVKHDLGGRGRRKRRRRPRDAQAAAAEGAVTLGMARSLCTSGAKAVLLAAARRRLGCVDGGSAAIPAAAAAGDAAAAAGDGQGAATDGNDALQAPMNGLGRRVLGATVTEAQLRSETGELLARLGQAKARLEGTTGVAGRLREAAQDLYDAAELL